MVGEPLRHLQDVGVGLTAERDVQIIVDLLDIQHDKICHLHQALELLHPRFIVGIKGVT